VIFAAIYGSISYIIIVILLFPGSAFFLTIFKPYIMVDLYRIKADLERMKCPYHTLPPQIKVSDGTLEIASSCCNQFKKLLLVNLAKIISDSTNSYIGDIAEN